MSLIDKIRKARETTIEINGKSWTIRRPTDEEATQFGQAGLFDIVKRFVIGWELIELEIIPGGGPEKVPFDSALFAEWVADQPEVWEPLGTAILEAYKAHAEKRDASLKN
jgi:hypothetical protein